MRRVRGLMRGMHTGWKLSSQDSSYLGASLWNKDLASWLPGLGSADADLLPDLPALIARSRDLARNHGIAAGAIGTICDNVVGIGLRLSAAPDYTTLGQTKDWADEWSNRVESEWRLWANSTECDAGNQLNFAGMTTLVVRSGLMNGEALALPLWLPDTRRRYATRMLMVESDRLSNPHWEPNTDRLRGGIEIDAFGAPQAYWIQTQHPGDQYLGTTYSAEEWERVPAETEWGRRRVIHVHDKERTGQSRGKPWFAPVLMPFRQFDQYQRAELQAAIVNALVAAVIETPLDSAAIIEMMGGTAEMNKYIADKQTYQVGLKSGAVIPLYPGDRLQSFAPSRPANQYPHYTETVLRHIGVSLGLPYESLIKDFSKTNYSSARAALLEAWRLYMRLRGWLAAGWASPVYSCWLEEAVNSGRIEAPGYYENRHAYARCKWIGPGRGWIDPMKEAEAGQIRLRSNVTTLEFECAEQGLDWREVAEQRALEKKFLESLGLTDPGMITPTGKPVQEEGDNDEAGRAARTDAAV